MGGGPSSALTTGGSECQPCKSPYPTNQINYFSPKCNILCMRLIFVSCAPQGHSGNVTSLDFSSNGKYLASCADDRAIRIWSTKDFLEREHKCLRANVELDHATLVRFSPDSRSASFSRTFLPLTFKYWNNLWKNTLKMTAHFYLEL